ncbi:MAG: hypothetical protein ACE37D_21615 [Pseudomonadales bacterium]
MAIEFLAFLLAIFAHAVIFMLSKHEQRRKRLVIAIALVLCGYPVMVLGILVGLGGNRDLIPLAQFLLFGPVFMSAVSFLVYRFVNSSKETPNSHNPSDAEDLS